MPDARTGLRSGGVLASSLFCRRRAHWLTCTLAAAITAPVQSQGIDRPSGSGGREMAIQPRVAVTETFSNNVQSSATQPLSDAVTQFAAGVNFTSSSGRLRGYLDYMFSGFRYARNSELNTHQNALNANLGAELIENRARLDVLAGISQAAESAFGVQPGLSGLPSDNLTETATMSISPSFYGPVGTAAQYTAGLSFMFSNSLGTDAGDSSGLSGFVRLGPASPEVVGWSVELSSAQTDFAAGTKTVDNRLIGTVNRKIDALDLLVSASAGAEGTNLASFDKAQYWNYGIGATWEPSPRTRLVAQLDERFFGRAHTFIFEHRTALTTWTFSDTRSLTMSSTGTTPGGQSAAFDLYYAQFASLEPDPAKRTQLVNQYLIDNPSLGTPEAANNAYLRSGETVVRSQNAAVAYRGVRSAAVLSVNRSVTVPTNTEQLPSDDFANTSSIYSESVSMNLSHRLTPMSSVGLNFLYQHNYGDQPDQSSSQRQITLQYLARLTDRSDLVIGARRSLYSNYGAPYDEGGVFAGYNHRF